MCNHDRLPVRGGKRSVGLAYPKNSMLLPLFNSIEMKLVQSGAVRKMVERNKLLVSMENCPKNNHIAPDPIDFDVVSVLFECLIIGMVISITTAMMEFALSYYKKQKKTNNLSC